MRLLILSAAAGVALLSVLPASAEVVVRAGEGGVAIHERDGYHHSQWRRHHASCRTIRERITTASGRVIVKTRTSC